MEPLIIVLFIVIAIVAMVFGFIAAQKRREAMLSLASRLGMHFDPGKDKSIARQYDFLDKLRQGHNRYACNILSGNYRDHEVKIFDYHYQTGSGKNTHHYHISFFMLQMPMVFPELTIGPEGIFSKIGQSLGYDDIDFESHEFSRKFCVRSKDKKFAYDFCNAQMIEYLLSNSDMNIEIEHHILAISFSRRLSPENIEPNLERLFEIRSLMPNYLFERR
ncbi:MAG: hypothetical protein JW787_01090 [Sedimentisphaerales bacterium]|nr:hypothetical protein [Sedimentisphaerales bacterium]